jgi:DNA-binding CsgD family transcriptional regulator
MAMLVPHVRHALILGRELQKVSSERLAALAALDEVSCGVMWLDQGGALLTANKGARRMLERGDGLRIDGGRVIATTEREKGKLTEVIRQVCAETTIIPGDAVTLTLHRSGQQSDLLARITAAHRPAGSVVFAHDRASVMLFLIDPDCHPLIDEQLLRHVYGLTKSEGHFAALLATGEDLDKIADRLCVSRNTVRTHLQRVYLKTDTRRQGDLIRFLLAGFARAA